MAKFFQQLTPAQCEFIKMQKIFFTATAPQKGRINLSPKGMDTFRIIDNQTVAYLDLTGSGNETAAHIMEDRRMTIMMCAFEGDPLILRLYGKGQVITPTSPDWQAHMQQFNETTGMRQIILLHIDSVQTSCGFGVPTFVYSGERETLVEWANKKGPEGIVKYRRDKNRTSIDGIDIPIDY